MGRALKLTNLLSFDMGGTTSKGALVRGGAPIKRYNMEVARVHEFRHGSGLNIRIPAIDMIEIGAGGGSIAEIDSRGLLRVGPAQRRRRSGSRLLWPRRQPADADGCQPHARLPRCAASFSAAR